MDSSGTDLFISWVKLSEHEILVEHVVDIEKAIQQSFARHMVEETLPLLT